MLKNMQYAHLVKYAKNANKAKYVAIAYLLTCLQSTHSTLTSKHLFIFVELLHAVSSSRRQAP